MAEGTAKGCFVRDNLEMIKSGSAPDTLNEEILKNCAAVSYSAGSDTYYRGPVAFFRAGNGPLSCRAGSRTGRSRQHNTWIQASRHH
ncbi:unnamed protein product [Cyclocybe aegerita]|uniref:Uncharacterized protein n=1 Tax=Cyclocybe aegerita TaxID=1973307 RepID=A0A8S0VQ59_CYCAE|nr:unnamed protein product [Cyclocybe aegerita]